MSLAMTQKIAYAQGYPTKFEFGTPATEQEIAAVAIAIPGDGSGLPAGSGDYAKGKAVYEAACAACHGADLSGVVGLSCQTATKNLKADSVVPTESRWLVRVYSCLHR
jgi:cytochrome c